MLTLPDHFDELLHRIEPDEDRQTLAQSLPAYLRKYLQGTELIVTLDPHSRLAGSYARHTAIKQIKDVDIILRISDAYLDEPLTAFNNLVKALKLLPNYEGDTPVVDDPGEISLRRQRRSVQVHFAELMFDVDVVPAIAQNGMDARLLVPDREWKKWVPSDALRYGSHLSVLNDKNLMKVVPLIKMLKHWRDMQMTYLRPKSFWLECMVVQYASDGLLVFEDKSYAEIFHDLLVIVHEKLAPFLDVAEADWNAGRPHIPDPMIPANNVAFNWEKSAFETFMARIEESLGWTKRALDKTDDQISDAISLWCKVFNDNEQDYFPTWTESPASKAAHLASIGQLRVSKTGQIITESSAAGLVVPPHRFYGENNL